VEIVGIGDAKGPAKERAVRSYSREQEVGVLFEEREGENPQWSGRIGKGLKTVRVVGFVFTVEKTGRKGIAIAVDTRYRSTGVNDDGS
jgi:hypothetical protein